MRDLSCGDTRVWLVIKVRHVDCRTCGKVKTERLDFLAETRSTRSGLPGTSGDVADNRRCAMWLGN